MKEKQAQQQQQQQQQQQEEDGSGITQFVNKKKVKIRQPDFDKYEQLCRGEQTDVGIPHTSAF